MADALTKDSGFAGVDLESLLQSDGVNVDGEPIDGAGEVVVAGKREVVGVSGVSRAGDFGEGGEAEIEAIRGEIRERG